MLTGLELTFMGLTGSNSGLFRAAGFIVSPMGEGESRRKNGEGKEGKRNRKEWKERRKKGKGIKNWRKDKKKEF